MRRLTPTVMIALATLLVACSREPEQADPGGHVDDPNATTDRIGIPATVRRNLGITFATPELRRVEATLYVPGSFELSPLARHEYRMILAGEVELLVSQYDAVDVGTPLYRFRSPRWPDLQHEIIEGKQAIASATGQVEVARAGLEQSRVRLGIMRERIAALAAADFRRADLDAELAALEATIPKSEAELTLASTALSNAMLTYEHALHRAAVAIGLTESELIEARGEVARYRAINWIEVTAKAPGVVEMLAVTDGGYVEPPGLVLSTVDPTRVRFRALGLQSDLARYAEGLQARIVPAKSIGLAAGDAIDAEFALGLEADPAQRTITLIANPATVQTWTRPGVSAFLQIVTAGGDEKLAIPRSAVVKDGLTHVIFLRDPRDPNTAIRIEADLGADDGRWVEVNSGLSLGDEVVLDGAHELKLATSRSGTDQKGGHFHADGTFHAEDD